MSDEFRDLMGISPNTPTPEEASTAEASTTEASTTEASTTETSTANPPLAKRANYERRYRSIYDLIDSLRALLGGFAWLVGIVLVLGLLFALNAASSPGGPGVPFFLVYIGIGVSFLGTLLGIRAALLLALAVVDIGVHTAPISDTEKHRIIDRS